MTAEKLLEFAQIMIDSIEKGKMKFEKEEREEAPIIPIEILQQKYLLNSGLLYISLNQDKLAC